jgi:transcriptional regulator with XRE-family HTH domain
MITGAQIRAARALLQWSTAALARRCGVIQELIREAESINGAPNLKVAEIAAIESALRAGGVEFIDGEYYGVRMKRDRLGLRKHGA